MSRGHQPAVGNQWDSRRPANHLVRGHAQIFEMTVHGGNGKIRHCSPACARAVSLVPRSKALAPILPRRYVRFARDFREGTHVCPTFDDAVTRHRMLHAIEDRGGDRPAPNAR